MSLPGVWRGKYLKKKEINGETIKKKKVYS
jgi:hypothetical protein